ncbi:oxidoreductase, zinc-binding dehydrogenase family [Leptolyngbya sp. NIES-3755]|nr:oxidoreductase, zinc-binding dehydrogenase family [Leptolyngbya sp. NIES-3755]
MKAIQVKQFGTPDVLKLVELSDPTPAPGQVVIRVHAAGVSPLDTYVREQSHGAPTPSLPYIPGFEAAGTIASVGEDVTRYKVGDRVYTNVFMGAYAELLVQDAIAVYPLPDQVSFAQGTAAVNSYPTAHYALFNLAKATPDSTVFVHGASGAVGLAAVQIAQAAGMKVVGSAGSTQGMQLVEQEGAMLAVNHREPNYLEKAVEFTNSKGFDVILEMNATQKLADDVGLVAPFGRIIVIGGTDGAVTFDPTPILWKGASIIGLYIGLASPEEQAEIHAAIYAGLENGSLRPQVAEEFSIDQSSLAHETVRTAQSAGKIAIVF